jgi:ABC-type dipeptide/oligopeptide/nickel transport system ATPase component
MKIYALVGKSGSGKSYQAIGLCRRLAIESILDDGLFILGDRVLAGISAKRQDTKVKAIKTALFTEEMHRRTVARKIEAVDPQSILVLGTSDKMIEKIVDRLRLPHPSETIYIEEITTEDERRIANVQRNELGKHIIPAPSIQLKKEFSGYFIHPLRMIRERRSGRTRVSSRSVVRPSFSYPGKYIVSNRALLDIALIVCDDTPQIDAVLKASADNGESGAVVNLSLVLRYGVNIVDAAAELQRRIAEQVETMTAFNAGAVNIEIRGLK